MEILKLLVKPQVWITLTLTSILAFGVLAVTQLSSQEADVGAVYADGDDEDKMFRWDLVDAVLDPPPGETNSGGLASAEAQNGGKITLSGSGTFEVPDEGGISDEVTGGGTWETFASGGASTGTGTYVVTGLVSWHQSKGTGGARTDNIGDPEDASGGLVYLAIDYDDGTKGILVVSCRRGVNDVFEGITASKGFVDYWERVPPAPEGGNRTLFHEIQQDEDKEEEGDD